MQIDPRIDSQIDPVVEHDAAGCRLQTVVDGRSSVLDYRLDGTVMTITHTGVPQAVRGRGIAGALVAAAFALARERGWKVSPACSYADAWARRHPAMGSLLA